ncbi:MAG TPA: hypothetical protein VGR20_22240 [Acidimicrobiia bacterium]|jgi:hypothetical protein|nr:hypothetical protein [Acidimicrobiia bacterium]
MRALLAPRFVAKPLLAVVLVGVSTWTGASPAGVAPHHEGIQVAAIDLPLAGSSTSTSSSTTTTEAPTTTTGAPPTTALQPSTTTATRQSSASTTAPPAARAPVAPASFALPPVSPPPVRDVSVYRGLGTWIDAYDFSPQFQANGAPPPITPQSMDDLAAVGVKTMYLQASKDDTRSPGDLVNPEILAPMLTRAHERGVRVVAWYLPKFYDLDSDMRRLLALRDFRAGGHGFDGIGLDIEWTKDVPNPTERSLRLIDLSQRLRAAMGKAALSAIPLPPVLIETVNPKYWPGFPWRELAPLYDVWMPMAYWTFRSQSSGYRDAYRYTEENVRRLRANLGLPEAVVHPVGGTDNKSSDDDYRSFVRACVDTRSLGGSIYDWRTTPTASFNVLRGVPG